MFNISQFRQLIVRPTLDLLQMYSESAEELLVFTCAAESAGGEYLHQIKGPALGIYQMEPDTYTDIWFNYIRYRLSLSQILALNFAAPRIPDAERLVYDLQFASAMCRIHYRRVQEALPPKDDIDAIWDYYKSHYNTSSGKSKKEKAVAQYEKFIK